MIERAETHQVRLFWGSLVGFSLLTTVLFILCSTPEVSLPDLEDPTTIFNSSSSSHSAGGGEGSNSYWGASGRPLLTELVDDTLTNITGDVQWLLDFGIVGFPQTGTEAIMHLLGRHDEVQMYQHEIKVLQAGKPAELVSLLYALPSGKRYRRGYKSSSDLQSDSAMEAISDYFPQTRLIIGLRHPCMAFESFYNMRAEKDQGGLLPMAEELVDKKLWIDKFRYQKHLAKLANISSNSSATDTLQASNPVFIYEVSQPFDSNMSRAGTFSRDLAQFLGLTSPLPPLVARNASDYKYAIDICDVRYDDLRQTLLNVSIEAADWIRSFVMQPGVTVSTPEYFDDLLASWYQDPCLEEPM